MQTQSYTPVFKVATVTLRALDDTRPGGVSVLPGGDIEITGLPLRALIYMAYQSSTIVAPSQVVGGPTWLDSEYYDIIATGEGTLTGPDGFTPTPHLIAMVRSLVNERFKLKIHNEKKEIPVYELVLADSQGKFGSRFVASKIDCGIPNACGSFSRSFTMMANGTRMVSVNARGVTMGDVALHFSIYPFVARPIFDKTGLAGRFDIVNLNYVGALRNPQVDSSARLSTSLVEQLGLQLRGARQAADVIVVDAAERPMQ